MVNESSAIGIYSLQTSGCENDKHKTEDAFQGLSSITDLHINQRHAVAYYSNPTFTTDTDITERGQLDSATNITETAIHQTFIDVESNKEKAKEDINGDANWGARNQCYDKIFRAKVFKTILILWNFAMFGWTIGLTGPTLPDLQLISGASLQQASWLFTGWGIGYLASCAASCFVHRKLQPDIVLFLYNTCQALSTGALPWIPNIYIMVVLRGVTGYCNGGQDIELTAMLFSIWNKEAGPYFQLTHVFLSIGGILSPLLVKPFLIQTLEMNNQNSTGIHFNGNGSTNTHSPNCNGTLTNGTVANACDFAIKVEKDTNVHFAYLISAIIMLTAAIPFLVCYISGSRKEPETEKSEQENSENVTTKAVILVVCLLCIVSALATALVDSLINYLATFGILQLHWSPDMGSSMTSLHFAMYAVGNFIGVFILKVMASKPFIFLSYIASIVSMALIYVGTRSEIPALQTVSVATNGLTVSCILPTLFTWTQEAVTPISGMIASAFLFAGAIGTMVNPIPLGYLMESVSPMWYIYLSVLEAVFCFIVFIVATIVTRKYIIFETYELEISNSNGDKVM